uniref:Uncharacterized protein n=1 Tax=Arundo donax TaxID=35708 RepID=A0A0A9C274_ARUDO
MPHHTSTMMPSTPALLSAARLASTAFLRFSPLPSLRTVSSGIITNTGTPAFFCCSAATSACSASGRFCSSAWHAMARSGFTGSASCAGAASTDNVCICRVGAGDAAVDGAAVVAAAATTAVRGPAGTAVTAAAAPVWWARLSAIVKTNETKVAYM